MNRLRAILCIAPLFAAFVSPASHALASGLYQPVVQVVTYTVDDGGYADMLGWGSASVIDGSGLLVSNNHVISSEDPATPVDAISICVTVSRDIRPDCRYTAHVLATDSVKDVSILRIDATDVFGEPTDFLKFGTLAMASEDELPVNQAAVTAIGYPWIGADTLSETT